MKELIPVVTPYGYAYQVTFEGLTNFQKQMGLDHTHFVHQGACSCILGETCPAVRAVINYLADGGIPAITPPSGYWAHKPHKCPICGSNTSISNNLSSPNRGTGWICLEGGAGHYWQSFRSRYNDRCDCNQVSWPHKKGTFGCIHHQDVVNMPVPVLFMEQ